MPEAPDNPLWLFSLRIYAAPGVADACLALQDRRDLDVNRLLHALWAGSQGRQLDTAALRRLDAVTVTWQSEVVRPLRAVRRHLKQAEATAEQEALRRAVKRDELAAEKIEQRVLHDLGDLGDMAPTPYRAAAANLCGYLAWRGMPPEPVDRQDLQVLLSAAFPELAPAAAAEAMA